MSINNLGAWWSSGGILALQPEGNSFKSDPIHCVLTFGNCPAELLGAVTNVDIKLFLDPSSCDFVEV